MKAYLGGPSLGSIVLTRPRGHAPTVHRYLGDPVDKERTSDSSNIMKAAPWRHHPPLVRRRHRNSAVKAVVCNPPTAAGASCCRGRLSY